MKPASEQPALWVRAWAAAIAICAGGAMALALYGVRGAWWALAGAVVMFLALMATVIVVAVRDEMRRGRGKR